MSLLERFLEGRVSASAYLHALSNGFQRVVYDEPGLTLVHGDCRWMAELDDDSVDLVVTDPPFNVRFSDYGGGTNDSIPPNEYAWWTHDWVKESLRVLRPGGQLYGMMPFRDIDWWLPRVTHTLLRPMGYKWHILPWCRTMAHLHREKTYIRAWEPLLWIIKGERPNVFNRSYQFADDKDWLIGSSAIGESAALRLKKRHPTPRPDWIYAYFILKASNRGDLVLDPMAGSGTGGRVSRKLGRRFIGYDHHRPFLDLAYQLAAQPTLIEEDIEESVAAFRQAELLMKWVEPGADETEGQYSNQDEEVRA